MVFGNSKKKSIDKPPIIGIFYGFSITATDLDKFQSALNIHQQKIVPGYMIMMMGNHYHHHHDDYDDYDDYP